MSKGLTEFEKAVYSFIEERGEVLTSNIPQKMMGAVPHLKNKGLVEMYPKNHNPLGIQEKEVRESHRTLREKIGVIIDAFCSLLSA